MALTDPVSTPQVAPVRHNLVEVGNVVEDDGGKWENGVHFPQRGCYSVDGTCPTCADPDTDLTTQECVAPAEFLPYLIEFSVEVNAADRFDFKALGMDEIERNTSSRLEQLIWSGCEGNDSPLLSEGTVVGSAEDPKTALGEVLAELLDVDDHGSGRGVIHMSPAIAVHIEDLLVERDGAIYTKFGGHKVVLGNYPATHMAAHIGEIDLYLGEPYITEAAEDIRANNVNTFRVQRFALAAWNTCAAFLKQVTLP